MANQYMLNHIIYIYEAIKIKCQVSLNRMLLQRSIFSGHQQLLTAN